MPSQTRFPLTRYFVATGVITAVVVAVALAAASAREVREDLIQERQELGVLIARNVNRQVHERFLAPTIEREGFVDLGRPEQLELLDQVVRGSVSELEVVSVYFFDQEGRIIYSTNLEHIGFSVSENPMFDKAREGHPASVVVDRGDPLDIGGITPHVNLLETYVPVFGLDAEGQPTADQTGVIEIYQDATQLLAGVRSAMLRVATYVIIAIVSLMLTLWLWIRKADRTIEDKARALIEANASLETLSRDLEQQVEDRSRRLLQAETLATVGTLSAGVAHEINNPIAAIASSAEGLLRRAQRSSSLSEHEDFGDFPEYLEIIRDEAFRVKTITRNLLDFSRSSQPGRSGPVDLRALVEATARLVTHQVQSVGKRLELDLGEEPLEITGDAASLRQLALNLTVNAIDATPSGGTIRWTLRPTEGGVRLACEDDGQGFRPEELEHALEPFFTGKPAGQGTGLGLSICYSVVKQHGGSIHLENKRGQGARVSIDLPQRSEEATDAQEA